MPLSSKWLDSLYAQLAAGQGQAEPFSPSQAVDDSPEALGYAAAPSVESAMPPPPGSTSGLAMDPPQSSFLDRLGAGAAQGGFGGGLAAMFTDPNADRTATGSNAWDAFRGITQSIGRAIGSAYGNPGFALAARRVEGDQQYQNAMLQQQQAETDAALQERQQLAARQARVKALISSADTSTDAGRAELHARLYMVDPEAAAGFAKFLDDNGKSLKRSDAKPPQSRTRNEGGVEIFEEYDANTGTWREVSSAPRWNPRSGGDNVNVTVNSNDTLKTAMDTRKDYLNESRDFVTIRDARDAILSVNKDQSPAADMAMIFSYMKLLDPSSTVREGEYANAQNTAGWTERARGLYNQAASGRILTERQRREFISATDRLYGPRLEQQRRRESDYKGTLNRFDLPADEIIPKTTQGVSPYFGDVQGTPDAAAAPPQPLPQDHRTLNVGVAYRLNDGRVGVWNGTAFEVQ